MSVLAFRLRHGSDVRRMSMTANPSTTPDPEHPIRRIAVLGSGLLGGSIALAIQKHAPHCQVSLWGRREDSILQAAEAGILAATTDLSIAIEGADLIILSSPVGAMLEILQAAADQASLAGKLVTDVGSVKLTPRDTLGDLVSACGARYLGSHPMAGSEQTGVAAASADLFQQAACVLTNDFNHPQADLLALNQFWQSIGCHCHVTTSEEHDQVMARISHLPHILASVGALVGLKQPSNGEFAGNGMRDTTRVASGAPDMWAEILLRNRAALKTPIEESIGHLREILAFLEQSSDEALARLLDDAKQLRDQI
ncbi:MAG: prephenate dehydrogenase [Akkermansiaceae bacterium]